MSLHYEFVINKSGLLYIVNNVLDALRLAELEGFKFRIVLENSLYQNDNEAGEVWNYYFEDPFTDLPSGPLPRYPYRNFRTDHLLAPRVIDGVMDPLLLPKDPHLANQYVRKYLHLKPDLAEKIERCAQQFLQGPVIGLHLRGPGRLHGGMPEYIKHLEIEDGVPFQAYFAAVDAQLEQLPDAKIFTCTDSDMVIEKCKARYGNRIVCADAIRSAYGEVHEQPRYQDDAGMSRRALGEEVLIDAYLLSRTNFLIHGNSNVSNFIVGLNPELPRHYVYEDLESAVDWHAVHARKLAAQRYHNRGKNPLVGAGRAMKRMVFGR